MKADKLIQSLFDYHLTVDTELKFQLLNEDGSTQFLELVDVSHNADFSGDNALSIVLRLEKNKNMSKIQKVKMLRNETGADLKTCVDALDYSSGDLVRARDYIKYGW